MTNNNSIYKFKFEIFGLVYPILDFGSIENYLVVLEIGNWRLLQC